MKESPLELGYKPKRGAGLKLRGSLSLVAASNICADDKLQKPLVNCIMHRIRAYLFLLVV